MKLLTVVIAMACSACSSSARDSQASVEADAQVLENLLGTDPALPVLAEFDEALSAERPVMAADLLESAGIPAVRRQLQRFESAEVRTPEGTRLRTRAIRIHRDRVRALEAYRTALARGIGTEDETLLAAISAVGDAERQLLALHEDLGRIRPFDVDEGAGREVTLGGLPPIRRRGESPPEEENTEPAGEPDPRLGEPTPPLPEVEP